MYFHVIVVITSNFFLLSLIIYLQSLLITNETLLNLKITNIPIKPYSSKLSGYKLYFNNVL